MCECISYNRPDWGGTKHSVMMTTPTGKGVCIDPCLAELVQAIWDAGIETRSTCCGHNGHDGAHVMLAYPDDVPAAARIVDELSPVAMHITVWGGLKS